jgi:YhcG PDDEXK nuclease domain
MSLYLYLRFYQTYPEIVRSVTAQLQSLVPESVADLPEKVRSATARLSVEPDVLIKHRILKCHVLIDLKIETFTHENIGQLNTYVSWYRKNMMLANDNPPIGILLCTQKDHALVEYALAGMDNSLFVSKYQLELPSKEDMQRFLEENVRTTS